MERQSDLEDHVEFAQLILNAIGYKIFEPLPKTIQPLAAPTDEETFQLSRRIKQLGRTISAQMRRTSTGYKVLAGSEISPLDDGNLSANVKKARNAAQIEKTASGWILREDVEFDKPSTAATFVLAMSADGNSCWKTRDGVPLKNFLQGGK